MPSRRNSPLGHIRERVLSAALTYGAAKAEHGPDAAVTEECLELLIDAAEWIFEKEYPPPSDEDGEPLPRTEFPFTFERLKKKLQRAKAHDDYEVSQGADSITRRRSPKRVSDEESERRRAANRAARVARARG
jgi:hypothetical protein